MTERTSGGQRERAAILAHEHTETRKEYELSKTTRTRAKVRQIHITGNRRAKEKVIRRQLEIAPGDYFRQSQVLPIERYPVWQGTYDGTIGSWKTIVLKGR